MTTPLYLDPEHSGIRWLLDPAAPGLVELARALDMRTPETPCDPDAVAKDLDALPDLLRERHFGVAIGLIDEKVTAEAERLIRRARERVIAERPRTWGAALGDLNDELRHCLRDRHVRLQGSPPSRIRADEAAADVDEDAPAVEFDVHDGVLCITVRRFWGGPDDDKRLWDWAGRSLENFRHDRIIVDLRGNTGGNDAVTYAWIEPVQPPDVTLPGTSLGWYVGDAVLGLWNVTALIEARDGRDAIPSWHLEHRHTPRPDDVLATRREDDEPITAGDHPWIGRMLVLVDGHTKSSGESSAWALQHLLGARLIGRRTAGMIEYGNVVPYLLPAAGLHIALPTKHNDFGLPVELVGFPVHADLDPQTPLRTVAERFDELYEEASAPI